MKLHNSIMREILEQSGEVSSPLTASEVDTQYQLLLNKIHTQAIPVKSSSYYLFKNVISQFNMIISKQMIAATLVLVVGFSAITVGYGRTLAYSLSSDIKNAPNASEYGIVLDFTDVFLNGRVVSKDHIVKTLGNQENVKMIGGITGYEGPDPTTQEGIIDSYEKQNITTTEFVDPNQEETVIETTEDFARALGVSVEEAKLIEEEATKYPYGIGFETAIKFLELTDENEVTYIGVDAEGVIAFFATLTK